MKEALKIARNLVRLGVVNKVNSRSSIDVLFEDRDDAISSDVSLLESVGTLEVGDQVLCVFLGNGLEDGFCLGRLKGDTS